MSIPVLPIRPVSDISLKGRPIVTAIIPAAEWYDAEAYHQKYRESFHRTKGVAESSAQQPGWIRVPHSSLLLVIVDIRAV